MTNPEDTDVGVTLTLTDEQSTHVSSALQFSVFTTERYLARAGTKRPEAVYAAEMRLRSIKQVAAMLPQPPPREVNDTLTIDRLRPMLDERAMSVAQVVDELGCTDKWARSMIRELGARTAYVGQYGRRFWTTGNGEVPIHGVTRREATMPSTRRRVWDYRQDHPEATHDQVGAALGIPAKTARNAAYSNRDLGRPER